MDTYFHLVERVFDKELYTTDELNSGLANTTIGNQLYYIGVKEGLLLIPRLSFDELDKFSKELNHWLRNDGATKTPKLITELSNKIENLDDLLKQIKSDLELNERNYAIIKTEILCIFGVGVYFGINFPKMCISALDRKIMKFQTQILDPQGEFMNKTH